MLMILMILNISKDSNVIFVQKKFKLLRFDSGDVI